MDVEVREMTTSTIIVLVICCFLCPMGMFTVMNSKKKNEKPVIVVM